MAAITTTFGSGGANLTPNGSSGTPDLATALREIADDLAGLKPAAVTEPDADGTWGAEEAALINQIKARLNALAAYVITTTKG